MGSFQLKSESVCVCAFENLSDGCLKTENTSSVQITL